LKHKTDNPRTLYLTNYYSALRPYLAPIPRTRRLISDKAAGRILGAVGKKFVPADLDRSALRAAIEQAWVAREIIDKNRPGPRLRRCLNQLDHAYKAADKLASTLVANNDLVERVTDLVPEAILNIRQVAIVIKVLKERIGNYRTIANEYRRVPTATEWLAGVELPCIYEVHFRRGTGVSRDKVSGKPGGPMVRFIAAALNEARVPVKDETIVRAVTEFAALRKRRADLGGGRNIGQK
jgi:hypothetical protein